MGVRVKVSVIKINKVRDMGARHRTRCSLRSADPLSDQEDDPQIEWAAKKGQRSGLRH